MDYILIGSWACIIAFCIFMYVILDGFTLGTGLMLPFVKSQENRNILFSAILPTWDGNQTWLVLTGASLYGAFPIAFSTILPSLYLPLMFMVIALLFRGICFEFRLKSHGKTIDYWDYLFFVGALIATFMQGLIFGNIVNGFTGTFTAHVEHPISFLNGFSIFCGLALVVGYALLGSTRMVLKTEGSIQHQMNFIARGLLVLMGIAFIVVSLWAPFVHPYIHQRWFETDSTLFIAAFPVITAISFIVCFVGLVIKNDYTPYYSSVVIFLTSYAGFAYTMFPYMVPYRITIWDAAANHHSLAFMMFGAITMIPLLLVYTGYSYHIFRGKVKDVIRY